MSLASGSGDTNDDKTIMTWATDSDGPLRTLNGKSNVFAVAFSPVDSSSMASGSDDTTVKLWKLDIDVPQRKLSGHDKAVRSVCFSPDGKYIASGSEDYTVNIWDISSSSDEPFKRLQGHSGVVRSVCFSPSGKYVASGSEDKTVNIWDISSDSNEPLMTLETPSAVYSVAFSPGNKHPTQASNETDDIYLASGLGDRTIKIWTWGEEHDVDTRFSLCQILSTTGPHADRQDKSVAFSLDSKYVASNISEDDENKHIINGHLINIWTKDDNGADPTKYKLLQTVDVWWVDPDNTHYVGEVTSLAFSPDNLNLASGSDDTTLTIWTRDDTQYKVSQRWYRNNGGPSDRIASLAFSSDNLFLASALDVETIIIWRRGNNGTDYTLFQTLHEHSFEFYSVAFSPDNLFLASASADHLLRIWIRSNDGDDDIKYKIFQTVQTDARSISCPSVAFSPDNLFLAMGLDGFRISIWTRSNDGDGGIVYKLFQTVEEELDDTYRKSVTFSPDSRYLATNTNKHVTIWTRGASSDSDTKYEFFQVLLEDDPIGAVAFSSDTHMASCLYDNTTKIWALSKVGDNCG